MHLKYGTVRLVVWIVHCLVIATPESQALKNANECCVRKLNDPKSTTQSASCECLIKPSCDDGDSTKCNEFAENCCQEDDQQCKCQYQTKACRIALESDSEEVRAMASSYCGGGAESACCGDDNDDRGLCKCDFWEPLCTDFPNIELLGRTTCSQAADSCCGISDSCLCDLFTHAAEVLGHNNEDDPFRLILSQDPQYISWPNSY